VGCTAVRPDVLEHPCIRVRDVVDHRGHAPGRWDGMGWDGMGWDGMGWDGMGWDRMGPMGWEAGARWWVRGGAYDCGKLR
jgi:hypothetical protein